MTTCPFLTEKIAAMLSLNKVSLLLFGSLCWGGGASWSDELRLPEVFNVLEVNGEKQKFKLFEKERVVPLTKGPQKILLQYEDFYGVGFDDHEKVKSKPFILSFEHEGGDLKADFNRPEFLKIAQLFAENPDLKLVDVTTGKRVSMDLEPMKKTEPTQSEVMNSEAMKPAVLTSVSNPLVPELEKSPAKKAPIEQLRVWWKRASLEERKTFMTEILN